MKLFLTLLTMISSYSLFCAEKWFVSLVVLSIVFFIVSLKYRHNRRFLAFLVFLCSISIVFKILPIKTFQNPESFTGLVVEKKNSYVILFDGLEKLYFKVNDVNIDLFDVVEVKGIYKEFSNYKEPLESGFNFAQFLGDKGVDREIWSYSYTTILNNPINIVQYKNQILSQFNNTKELVLAKALLFGESSYDDNLFLTLKSSGLIVLISLSSLIINSLYFNLVKILSLKLSKKISQLIALLFLSPLLFFNLDSISILRFFIYRGLCLFYLFKEKRADYLALKSVSFISLIIADRFLMNSLSILLPMVVSFGLFFANMLINKRKFYLKKIFFYIVLVLLFIPFNLQLNNCFNVVNNMITILLIPIISIIVALLIPSLFMLKIPFIGYLLTAQYDLMELVNFKYLNLNAPPLNQYHLVIYYIVLFVLFYFLEAGNKFIYKKIRVVMITFLCVYFLPIKSTFTFSVSFINVGQGDSTLISYRGKNLLVDTGGSLKEDIATNNLIPFLRKNKIYKIDYLFITHYDMDHYYASKSLKRNFIVGKVYDYTNFSSMNIGDLSIYNINTDINNVVEENDKSLVLHLCTPYNSLLLMGDASKSVEYKIMDKMTSLSVEYLKCGHHGSNTSTSIEFLRWLKPKEAIISCGDKNKYGHPHKEVIDALNEENIIIRRTDKEGTITYRFSS